MGFNSGFKGLKQWHMVYAWTLFDSFTRFHLTHLKVHPGLPLQQSCCCTQRST